MQDSRRSPFLAFATIAAILINGGDQSAFATQNAGSSVPIGSDAQGAIEALKRVISLCDKHKLPNWTDPKFSSAMRPYLTGDFIHAVEHGRRVGGRYNIWDGDLITASGGMVRARLWGTKIIERRDDGVVIEAMVSISDEDKMPLKITQPTIRYWLKREKSSWKIDDLKSIIDLNDLVPEARAHAASIPSAKTLFKDPDKYLSQM